MEGLKLSPAALLVLWKRYLEKDQAGNPVETPEVLFRRVARNVAQADSSYQQDPRAAEESFYEIMSRLEFLPNSPALLNAGRRLQQLAACFVLPVEDSLEGIFEAIKQAAIIHQSGGGTGFSFSRLRPKNDIVSTSGGPASGPVSFIQIFNESTEVVNQGGFRRGANMAVLHVQHPDILEFIHAKNQKDRLTNFNISVGITDLFMNEVKRDGYYGLINPRTGAPTGRLKAREVFQAIVDEAWMTGEPGALFLDTINTAHPTPQLGNIESTNPCGEQPLLPFESCVLGSINLNKMVIESKGNIQLDWQRLSKVIRHGVHFLDNVIDVNRYQLPQIRDITQANRKIGLGLMGFADVLIKLGIPYNSKEALEFAERLMSFFSKEADHASVELAGMRGVFPNLPMSIYNKSGGPRYRNASRTTIAPTGSISIIANCSSGIEPVFAISYTRRILDNTRIPVVYEPFVEVAKEKGFYSKRLMARVSELGSIQNISDVPEDVKRVFVTARDITPEWHVRMQAAFQRHTDNAVSKTINLSAASSREDVEKAYLLAYELGCKGITVYRDTSRVSQSLAFECLCDDASISQ